MALEFAADPAEKGAYPMPLAAGGGAGSAIVLDWAPLIEALVADLRRGADRPIMAARFHNALVDAIVAVAQRVGVARIALSGGCFQNRRLAEHSAERLERDGFEVVLHRQVPPNDGGISLGQLMVAAASLRR
jgi:hydrogenase maturation protein HypF